MKKLILSFLTLSIVLISCQQDDPPVPVTTEKYMSLTTGSTWNYELINNVISDTNSVTLTATSKDSTINTKTYRVFTNSSGSSNEYFNITGNDYYTLTRLPASFGGTSVENKYLKDNTPVNDSWSQSYPLTISGATLNVTVTNTITEKGISKTVKGTTYTGVIHVTTTIAVASLPASALTTDIHSYYTAKLGLIQSINKINLNFSGYVENINQQTNLIAANIK